MQIKEQKPMKVASGHIFGYSSKVLDSMKSRTVTKQKQMYSSKLLDVCISINLHYDICYHEKKQVILSFISNIMNE